MQLQGLVLYLISLFLLKAFQFECIWNDRIELFLATQVCMKNYLRNEFFDKIKTLKQ